MSQQSKDPKQVQKSLGNRIMHLRTKKGWSSQEAFAEACGMNRGRFDRIERGEVTLHLSTVAEIARTLNMTVSELFEDVA